ncbi:uncharacterized protein [Elaeis guineensis]|uniref:Uncharacterized protein LOC105050251 n=1 Tax=Elaeis guineensis var. tenera TaxID=51953 RepID=A0A6I9RL60_ELAGV|nr:uncharacterized protein LOC105050251 [Elaeis guineensis]XP_029121978.1 uncharacterized protein LOC105050251 [Elaeis guineensis]
MVEESSAPSWEQRIQALTHILTNPTTAPSLHSQLFVATHIPCFLRWDYPPFLCPAASSPFPSPLLRWSFSLFLSRAARLGLPRSSWRSKCPFQQPPPLVLSSAVEAAPPRWGPEERRAYFRRRLRRGRLGVRVPPILVFAVPNLALLSLLFWDPTWLRRWT